MAAGRPTLLGLHWCLAPQALPPDRLGPDGHPRKGELPPDIPLPRRMWAGGSLAFIDKLRIGDKVSRISEITSIKERTGKSGALVFVQVSHRLTIARGPLLEEMQDIVNREPPADVAASEMPPGLEPMQFREGYGADSILLFRYSALTFNRHRIHYDEPYEIGVEGYDGLVVQGPLQGISRLPEVAGDKPAKQPFKGYPIGYFHIDIAEVRTEQGKLHMFVAVDRTSKFAFVELHEKATTAVSRQFLLRLIAAVPYKIHTVLTDNGIQFTTPGAGGSAVPLIKEAIANGELFRAHAFEYACARNDIEHRTTKARHPWTNGQVERMNRTIKDATVRRFYYESHDQLRQHLTDFVSAYNFARRLKTLKGLTPYGFICKEWTSQPNRFNRNPLQQMPGLNT